MAASSQDGSSPAPIVDMAGQEWDPETAWDSRDIYKDMPFLGKYLTTTGVPHIRLLRIEPASELQDLMHTKLITRPIYDASYIALSYAWGSSASLLRMIVNGHAFPVSLHLLQGLRRLRRTDKSIDIWVDAICIDQNDTFDKSFQIKLMPQIYNQATEVRTWLGDGFEFLGNNKYVTMQETWDIRWWERLWIVQEVAFAASSPLLMTGASTLTLQSVMESESEDPTGSEYTLALHWREIFRKFLQLPYQCWKQVTPRTPLLELLRKTVSREFCVPHDRVYALLSLLPDNEQAMFPPDYMKTYAQLKTEVNEYLSWQPAYHKADDTLLLPWGTERRSKWSRDELEQAILTRRTRTVMWHASLLSELAAYNLGVSVQYKYQLRHSWLANRDWRNTRMLESAVKTGDVEITRCLLDADLSAKLGPAFEAAAVAGQHSVLELLLGYGTDDTEAKDRQEVMERALVRAVMAGQLEAVKTLLNHKTPRQRATLLAMTRGNEEITEALGPLQKGMTPAAQSWLNYCSDERAISQLQKKLLEDISTAAKTGQSKYVQDV